MDYGLLSVFLFGLMLTIFGGLLLFSNRALNWMYREGIWKPGGLFGEKQGRQYDKYARGGRLFVTGLIIVVGSLYVFFFI